LYGTLTTACWAVMLRNRTPQKNALGNFMNMKMPNLNGLDASF
jgi:hypothetical protein